MGQSPFTEEILAEDLDSLAGFFDMLAKYDFEDEKKSKSEVNSSPLVSAPRGLELEPDLQQ